MPEARKQIKEIRLKISSHTKYSLHLHIGLQSHFICIFALLPLYILWDSYYVNSNFSDVKKPTLQEIPRQLLG